MEDRYSIENLIKTFARHAEQIKKQREEDKNGTYASLKETGNEDWDFDIALALNSMCVEILDMNDRINEIVDHLNGDRG